MPVTEYLSPHFTKREFACKHCGRTGVKLELVFTLEKLRERIGKPIRVGSGYRCAQHPETLKRPGSKHALGEAADIWVPSLTARALYRHVVEIPEFHGIGVHDARNFVHVDIRPGEHIAKWCYDRAGNPIEFREVTA